VSVSVLCRDAWGALPSGDGLKAHTISRLTVHHTARFLRSPADAPAAVRGHQRFHIEERGWPDLAYHYIISSDGYAFEGRPEAFRGDTATSYDPTGHFLVCLEGEFDTQSPSPEQLETLVRLLAYGAGKHAVDLSMIGGHRDFAATACPGATLYEGIADGSLRQRVSDLLTGGGVVLDRVCGVEGIEMVAQIEA
jgi:hypothetical protein